MNDEMNNEQDLTSKNDTQKEPSKAKKLFNRFFKKADESEDMAETVNNETALAVQEKTTSIARRNRAVPGAPSTHTLDASQNDSTTGALPSVFKRRTKRPNFIVSVLLTTLTMYLVVAIVFVSAGAGAVLGIAKAYTETTKNLDVSVIMDMDQTSFIYDSSGELITSFASIENRIMATYDEIPEDLMNAFVAIEDSRFWTHKGVDLKRLAGVFFQNFTSDGVQGGSTLTQQLIKQRILSSERSYKRKIQEAYLALQLERVYSKEEIITAYLNTIALGGSNYGVKAAAYDYFGKELNELTLRECAMLAGITQNPWRLNPRLNYYDRDQPERTDARTDTVLYRMYACDFITKEEYEEALHEEVHIIEESQGDDLYEMMYFVEYAVQDVVNFMLQANNLPDTSKNRSKVEQELRTGGYNIYLTVDSEMQKKTEEVIYNYQRYPRLANSADNVVSAQNADGTVIEVVQPQAAVAVLDHVAGEYRAIVGGRQAPTAQKQLNRAYMSSMPIGSSIKPVTVYGPAFDNGASPGTVVADMPVAIQGWGGRGYPNNYSQGFSGMTTIRAGLKSSLNVVAARVLADWVGVETSANYLLNMGVAESHINRDLSGLALGTSGITMVELTACYGTIANDGVYQQPVAFSRIEDQQGNIVLDPKESRVVRQIYKPTSVWMLKDILINYTYGATLRNMQMAGKTGTNSNWIGCTFGGFTAYYACTLWIGHDNYKPLARGATGSTSAAPLWKQVMEPFHEGLEYKGVQTHTASELGLTTATVCGVSGLLCNDACRADSANPPRSDYYVPGTQPSETCKMHVAASRCTVSDKLAGDYCPAACVTASAIVNLAGTPYENTDAAKYFPNAGSADLNNTCDIHTAEWARYYEALGSAISNAQSAISTANSLLGSSFISASDSGTLSNAKNTLSNMLGGDYTSASIGQMEATEGQIRAATSTLQSLNSEVSARIEAARAEYEAQQQQQPDTPPDDGGGEGGGEG